MGDQGTDRASGGSLIGETMNQKPSKLIWAALIIFPMLGCLELVMAVVNKDVTDVADAAVCFGVTMVAYYATQNKTHIGDKNF
jgi:hypothetical protein